MKLSMLIAFAVIGVYGGEIGGVYYYPRNYEDFYPTLLLVSSPDDEHIALNNRFEKIASKMGFIVHKVFLLSNVLSDYKVSGTLHEVSGTLHEVSGTLYEVRETINIAGIHPNVINLKISIKDLHSDYIMYQAFLESKLLCATDCYDYNLTYTRLISDNILNYESLLQIIESEDLEPEEYIQICYPRNTVDLPDFLVNKNMNWPLEVKQGDCAVNIAPYNSMLAIITNEASDIDSSLPTIFYQTPYILPEVKDRFPNSFSLSTKWQPLKYAFKEFLKRMSWYRVAILSDDSHYSEDFLGELDPLFKKEEIIFTDQKCTGRFCDFTYPLKLLKESDARIIILNVDKENAKQLVDTIDDLKMRGVTWIVRDWPFTKLGKVMFDIFSITLSPVFEEEDKFYPYLSSIREGIRIIDHIYKNVLGNREMFQRVFANEASRSRDFKTNAYITRMHPHDQPSLVAAMTIEGERTEVFYFTDKLYAGRVPSDLSQDCIVRSNNFFRPCSHEELLLLVCVCIMFGLSLLVLIMCFNKYRNSRFYNRFP